ncbi:MAG: HPr family phosphocarrier protein [Oscillospiraceae bacterium]|nr:HPr family phosphocarrier protein [Oscillospiraceae bacterium]
MIKSEFTINDELGIHARPAGSLAKLAKSLDSTVIIFKGDKFADASKLLAVMGLNVKQGDTVTVTIDGGNEAEAEKAVREFFEKNL